MTQYAGFEDKRADLSSEFGLSYAMKVFGKTEAEIEALVGRYVRGRKKGALRGTLVWSVVSRGGWVRRFGGGGFVATPGLRFGHGIIDSWSGKCFLGWDPRKGGVSDAISWTWSQEQVKANEERAKDALSSEERGGLWRSILAAGCDPYEAAETMVEAEK